MQKMDTFVDFKLKVKQQNFEKSAVANLDVSKERFWRTENYTICTMHCDFMAFVISIDPLEPLTEVIIMKW